MDKFADFLPFSEEVQEAFENYNLEASSLTIKALPKNTMGSVIGRVVWRSPPLKVGSLKNKDAIHFTILDAESVEVTGTAWGKMALKFHDILEQNNIYKFSNAVPISKTIYKAVENDKFESRVIHQSFELRFSGILEPELVRQEPYPNIDHTRFRSEYVRLKVGQVTAVVGLVVSKFACNEVVYIALSNGSRYCIAVSLSQEKLKELKNMEISPGHTILGILGVEKIKDINTRPVGGRVPKALFKTFDDSLFITEPICESTKRLVIWRDEYMQ